MGDQEQKKSQTNQAQLQELAAAQKDDQRIVGDEWKLDLSEEDRDLANEVEGKLKEVQKQMDLIEQKTKHLQNKMNFPFGMSSPAGMPKMDDLVDQQKQQMQEAESSNTEALPQPPKISYKDFPVIDARGNLITSKEDALEKYHNSPPFIRCLQLPFCYSQIKKKIQFWSVSSIGLSLLYNAFPLIRDRQSLKQLQFKPVMKKAGLIFMVGSIFSTLETLYFDDYCDVNSYHYQESNRAETIKYLKQRIIASQRK